VKEPYISSRPVTPEVMEEVLGYQEQQPEMTAGKPAVYQLFLAKVSHFR
jgi:hypothetical protein